MAKKIKFTKKEVKNMKLINKKYFEIVCGGTIEEIDDYDKLEKCFNLKIESAMPDEHSKKATIFLENGKKIFIEVRNIEAKQCLIKIIEIINKNYLDKKLAEVLKRDFCMAERIE